MDIGAFQNKLYLFTFEIKADNPWVVKHKF
jgi:hypothetical protein